MISLADISYHIAGRTLLDHVNLPLPANHRVGLVGRNGSGKTTLFRLLLNQLIPDSGKIEKPRNVRILTVAQDAPSGDQSPLLFLLNTDEERLLLFAELDTCEDAHRMGDIYERLIQIDAYTAEARAAKLLNGLGFTEADQLRPLDTFSGGYRMRVALAAALFQSPDLLLLDEPTNHLDFEATTWLKDFLKSYAHTLVIISHDRDLLNTCTQEIIHLHGMKLTRYKGNYDQFERTLSLKYTTVAAYNSKIEAQRAHWQKFVDRFKAKPSKSAQARSRIKAMEKLQPVLLPEDDATISLAFPAGQPLPSPIVTYEKISLGYGTEAEKKVVLRDLTGRLDADDRIALLGANGNGKSTFAKFLAGTLMPLQGEVQRSSKLTMAYFHQHQMETLDLRRTAYDHVQDLMPKAEPSLIRGHLGRFGFSGHKALERVGHFSGGEKARLVFSLICTANPHLLILDEPTNHLDMEMRKALIMAINAFQGAVILISHDWHLLEQTMDQLWLVENRQVHSFPGTLEEYRSYLLRGR